MMKTFSTFLTFLLSLFSPFLAGAAGATEVGLAGIMGSKALLVIDGGQPRAFSAGQQYNGVKLISVNANGAVVEFDSKTRSLRVGQNAMSSSNENSGNASATLMADKAGHFITTGTIDGRSVKFLVDTGATAVSMGISQAKQLGLDLSKGSRVRVSTANGEAVGTNIRLSSVKVGNITLYNVDATVGEQDMPFVLLGMSFLNRTNMQREGDTLTLKQRF